ncbi:hypothetical protein HZU77_004755 [Neisseriaceae bacterium TC5R-5]|nr:hypothetical protein [Neisseriaceae bacterium TC5R-5]
MTKYFYHSKWMPIFLLISSYTTLTPPAQAEASEPDNKKWHYEFTPYIWATGQDGTVGLDKGPGNGVAIDQSFSDILKRMDIAAMASFEARHDRWGILLDGIYLKISDGSHVSGPNGLVTLSADANITQQLYSVAGYYRAIEGETNLDTIAGLRYNMIRWDVNTQLSSPVTPDITRRFRENKNWLDPYLGLRVQHRLNEKWSAVAYGDVGGGTSSGANLSWQALLGVNYTFSRNIIGKFGYRHLYNDYHNDGFKYDMTTAGIYAGLGIAW